MNAPTHQLTTFVCAAALLVACDDLNLADKVNDSSAAAGLGGTAGSGKATGLGGMAPTGGASAGAGMPSKGSSANAGGASSSGASITGGNPATAGTSPTTLASGGASSTSVAGAGATPDSRDHRASGGNSATGGTSSATLATGGAASLGGTASHGGANGFGGVASSAGVMNGGNAAMGSVTFMSGGQSSTVSLSAGSPSIGGSSATAGEPGMGGTVSAGGASVSSAGSASTPSELGQGGVLGGGGTAPINGSKQDALKWQPCLSDLNQYVTTLAQAPQSSKDMLVGCSNGDVFITFDGLTTNPNPRWIRVDDWTTIGGTDMGLPNAPVNAIAYSPADVNTAYIAFAGSKHGRKLWKTTNSGTYWEEITNSPLSEIWSVSVNPLDARRVYLFGPGGAFMSPDSGDTWTADVAAAPMNVPIAAGAKLSTVSVAPGQPDVIWVGATNGDVFFTNDATSNQTWYQASKYMPRRTVTHLGLDISRNPVGAYATFDGMGPDSIWATANNGVNWSILQDDTLPVRPTVPGVYAFYGVSVNPIDSSVLYIDGTYGAGFSTSSGASWTWTDLP